MSFNLEITDMDLGDTPIENIFINDYMPMANGTYVKVYLLGYKYAHDKDEKIEVTNMTIAKHLNIPLEDVLGAWDFWEEKGIIEKIDKTEVNYGVKFLDLKQLYIKNNLSILNKEETGNKKFRYSMKDLIEANQMPAINNMFNNIDNIMRRQTVPTEKLQILGWIHDYNMNPDVIEKAFYYSIERKGIKSIKYIEGIIRNWYDKGVTNIEALLEHFKLNDERFYQYQRIMKSIGLLNRNITEGDMKIIDKWLDEYSYSMEIILKGCESSSKASNPTVSYIDGVISSWYKKGIRKIEDIEIMDKPPEKKEIKTNKNPTKKNISNKTRFHNFEQRSNKYSADELEEIARRKREAHFLKIKGD